MFLGVMKREIIKLDAMINSQTNLKVESIFIMHKYFLFSV